MSTNDTEYEMPSGTVAIEASADTTPEPEATMTDDEFQVAMAEFCEMIEISPDAWIHGRQEFTLWIAQVHAGNNDSQEIRDAAKRLAVHSAHMDAGEPTIGRILTIATELQIGLNRVQFVRQSRMANYPAHSVQGVGERC